MGAGLAERTLTRGLRYFYRDAAVVGAANRTAERMRLSDHTDIPEETAVTRLATEQVESSPEPGRPSGLARLKSPQAITLYCYLGLAIYVTCRLWTDPAGLRQVGDPQDVNQATWFVRYAANAVEHFRLPALITSTMNAPHTVNLMWNTPFLLPGILVAPVTLLFGSQVALTTILTVALFASAAAMFYVLRYWNVSLLPAAFGGFFYGFSPALINSGVGHYAIVIAPLPPLILDRVLRMIARKGSPVRNGAWLGLLIAGQLFIGEEGLVDTVIAALVLVLVLAACRPREVISRIKPLLAGLGAAAGVALVLCARALWVQFHGVKAGGAAATVVISYGGHGTNLGTLPYAFINPAGTVLLHIPITGRIAASYPQPFPEYLAYLGVPMIILLLVATVYFWRNLTIRVAGLACLLLEWLGMGAKPLIHDHILALPGWLLPWGLLQHLPVIEGMVPDRLCIPADLMAAVVLAVALDKARSGEVPWFANRRNGARLATAFAVVALLPILPSPYGTVTSTPLPAGWTATFARLHLPEQARVMVVPFPYSATTQVMSWAGTSNLPRTMIGGDFIAPDQPPHLSRAGRSALTPTTTYIDDMWLRTPGLVRPSNAQIARDLAEMKPQAVVAVPQNGVGKFLTQLFGPPTYHIGSVLSWRFTPAQAAALASGSGPVNG